jgi:O-antigen/teichoic acid export membrane protein
MLESSGKSRLARRLLIGATTNWAAFAATLLVAFFMTPYLVRRLGDGPYGVWAFVESLLAYFTLFDLGIAACVVHFVARYQVTGDRHDLNRLISTALTLFIGLGLLLLMVGAAVLPVILPSLAHSGVPPSEALGFALLMTANLAITLPLSIFPSILDGLEHFAFKSMVRVIVLAVRTAGTIVLMERQPSLLHLGLLFTACNLLEHVAFAAMSFRILHGLRISWRLVDRSTLRRVKGYSTHAFLAMVAGRACVQSGAIIVGIFLGAAPVTYFALASRLVEFAKALLRTATNTLTPAVSSLEAAGDHEAIRRMFLRGTRLVLYLIIPVQLGLIVFGRPFLTIWLGDATYAERCYPALVILSSTLTLVIAQSVASRILYGTGRLKGFARAAMLEAGANLLLSILLCPWFGLIGVAAAIAVPNLVMCLWVIGHTARGLDVPARMYISEGWLRPTLASVIPLSVWLMATWSVENWITLIAATGAGLLPYAIVVCVSEFRGQFRFGKIPILPGFLAPPRMR